jgi:hypothetical protein
VTPLRLLSLTLTLALVAAGCVESHDVPPCPYSHDAGEYECADADIAQIHAESRGFGKSQ